MMYEAFWEGKEPKPPPKRPQAGSGRRGGPAEAPAPSTPPKSAVRALEAEWARIQAIQAEKNQNK